MVSKMFSFSKLILIEAEKASGWILHLWKHLTKILVHLSNIQILITTTKFHVASILFYQYIKNNSFKI